MRKTMNSFFNDDVQAKVEESRVEVEHIIEDTMADDDVVAQCSEILRYKKLLIAPPPGSHGLWCDATYDGVLCWPAIPANSSISLPCPTGPGLNAHKHITKSCHWSGQWAGRTETDFASPVGYADYSVCRMPSYLKKYEMVVPPVDNVLTEPSEITSTFSSVSIENIAEINITASNNLKIYSIRNMELAGLILSLIAIFTLTIALFASRRINLRVNKIRLQVMLGIFITILVLLIRDFSILPSFYWISTPTFSTNVILVVLQSMLELGKCMMCIWVFVECLHLFLHVKLSDWEDLSFWCYLLPGSSISVIPVVIWLLVTYFTCKSNSNEPAKCIYLYENNPEYWILRTVHYGALTLALFALLCTIVTLTNEKSRSSDFKRSGEAFITLLVIIVIGLVVILPFANGLCVWPSSNFPGCITCFCIYFLGFFVAIFYAIAQIVSPWWNYIAVLEDHSRSDAW